SVQVRAVSRRASSSASSGSSIHQRRACITGLLLSACAGGPPPESPGSRSCNRRRMRRSLPRRCPGIQSTRSTRESGRYRPSEKHQVVSVTALLQLAAWVRRRQNELQGGAACEPIPSDRPLFAGTADLLERPVVPASRGSAPTNASDAQ